MNRFTIPVHFRQACLMGAVVGAMVLSLGLISVGCAPNPPAQHSDASSDGPGSPVDDSGLPSDRTGSENTVSDPSPMAGEGDPPSESERHAEVRRLFREGQWVEACQRIDALAAEGIASFDEMCQLTRRRGTPREENFQVGKSEVGGDGLSPVAASPEPLAVARIQYAAGNYDAAIRALESSVNSQPGQAASVVDRWPSPAHASFYGRVLAKQQEFAQMPGWLRECPDGVEDDPDYWTAVAALHWNHGEAELAVGAVLEALELDSTSNEDHLSLQIYLVGDEFAAVRRSIDRRYRQIVETQSIVDSIRAGRPRSSLTAEIANRCFVLARPLEAMQWTSLNMDAIEQEVVRRGDESELARVQLEHRTRRTLFQRQRMAMAAQPELAAMERRFRRFDLPEERFGVLDRKSLLARYTGKPGRIAKRTQKTTRESQPEGGPTSFNADGFEWLDVAPSRGLSFRYANHTPIVQECFRLHETLGGGIGVIDFDLDDHWDLYLVQGGGDPPATPSDLSDRLFRNLGDRFADVTRGATGTETAYGLGVAVGDLNQDGFPDIAIGNFGPNRVLFNQGDGTFREVSNRFDSPPGRMTTGLAVADVTGDGVVDLVEVNYVDDEEVLRRRPKSPGGTPQGLSPNQYGMAGDRLHVQSTLGEWQVTDLEPPTVESMIVETGPQSSLGLVVGDFDERPGNEVIVANDARPNRYWIRPSTERDSELTRGGTNAKRIPLVESAAVAGLARDSTGAATASMGIAVADFDGDHRADIHMTNFYGEASSLYIQSRSSMFVDRSARLQLDGPTIDRVGFGTQTADFNQDGWLDLITLNGHIEDYSSMNIAFRMRPQVLAGHDEGFRLVTPDGASPYWKQPCLGRALAKVDFNNDGRMDLVAGHLDRPVALLENRSDSRGTFLRIRCVGTDDERDAIGAKVTVTPQSLGGPASGRSHPAESLRSQSQWVAAGGGYLAANDPRLHFVWPDPCERFQVVVRWPSGHRQEVSGVSPDQTLLIVQRSDHSVTTGRTATR